MTRERLTELARDWWRETAGYAQFSKTNVDSLTFLLESVAEVSKRECYGYEDGLIHGMAEQREADAKIAESIDQVMKNGTITRRLLDYQQSALTLPSLIAQAIREAK